MNKHDQLIQALLNSDLYDHPVESIRVLQTHISWIILTGPYAYKIKKPVYLDFVDCRALKQRRFFCDEELRLNRRLAPSLYLDIVPIYGSYDAPTFSGNGSPIEYAVKMKQFTQSQLLSQVIEAGGLQAKHIDDLIMQVSGFHATIAKADESSPFGAPELIDRQAQENFPMVLDVLRDDRPRANAVFVLQQWFERVFAIYRDDFCVRKKEGFVRECHGDMHLGNMILQGEEIVIFDGIDFNENLRWIDVGSEIAFLAMDLEDRGATELSRRFVNGYLEFTGDYSLLDILPFYTAYRAMVRAKVAAIRLQQSQSSQKDTDTLQKEMHSYLELAQGYAKPHQAYLMITHGVSGSGKTYATQKLLEQSGAIRIRSDVERKRLFGLQPLERSAADHRGRDIYTPDASARTYERLAQLAASIIKAGFSVIVDAAFLKQSERETFCNLARGLSIPFVVLEFEASEEILRQRIAERVRERKDASEADLLVLDKQLQWRQPLTEKERAVTLTLDTAIAGYADNIWERVVNFGADNAHVR